MIINCPCCKKKFALDENLIPDKGRLLQCGFCDETWFFDKDINNQSNFIKNEISNSDEYLEKETKDKKEILKSSQKTNENIDNDYKKSYELTKYNPKTNYSFSKFLSNILVFIISFVALIILLDTFKSPLYNFYPKSEILLYNLFEVLKVIKLFVKDLI